ncbi:protein-methionine-sulfoxide reductase catalytic subunit MsrP [Trichlorobacter ammonificans]|uniref:Protein-methionine-sulfoxide reductase catalytic subunit MsrP n=1 Tax=Trichlorobacter ammonificans TaxID=2916410 RepID=A0ABM9D4J6_9BACT|nr:protein-methionine-sulfoxide reductase catalytic subunit MsrP [Trichlorobacter ammonificans]CAH2030179.1 Protein-methionine-sulfoxide reductase catalytic subunit MsrP [Trichlorobacter ammonificans]
MSRYELPASELTPEEIFRTRRTLLKALGFIGLNAWPLLNACTNYAAQSRDVRGTLVNLKQIQAVRNPAYTLDRPLTDRLEAAGYTNFYEFTQGKEVWRSVDRFLTRPWEVRITGLVKKPLTLSIDELLKLFPQEERHYRFRCVETWAMAVPWTGFPLAALVKRAEPLSSATHLSLLSFLKRDQAPEQGRGRVELWPYHEGLTLPEAMNELAFLATGLYGRELPPQHGAPLRLVTPWKYGFKSIKSVVEIRFTDRQPPTFWSSLAPQEYGFWANINPGVPHPRWSQEQETLLGSGERRRTLLYNGYDGQVGHLYKQVDTRYFF